VKPIDWSKPIETLGHLPAAVYWRDDKEVHGWYVAHDGARAMFAVPVHDHDRTFRVVQNIAPKPLEYWVNVYGGHTEFGHTTREGALRAACTAITADHRLVHMREVLEES
jgi:hypothetical protein